MFHTVKTAVCYLCSIQWNISAASPDSGNSAVSKHVQYNENISVVSKRVSYSANISVVSKRVSYSADITVVSKRISYSANVSVMSSVFHTVQTSVLCLSVFHTVQTSVLCLSMFHTVQTSLLCLSVFHTVHAYISVVFKHVSYSVNISVVLCYRCERSAASHVVQRPKSSYLENWTQPAEGRWTFSDLAYCWDRMWNLCFGTACTPVCSSCLCVCICLLVILCKSVDYQGACWFLGIDECMIKFPLLLLLLFYQLRSAYTRNWNSNQ